MEYVIAPCEVCYWVDGDERQKPTTWCGSCQAYICDSCMPRRFRRAFAMFLRKIGQPRLRRSGPLPILVLVLTLTSFARAQGVCPAGTQNLSSLNAVNNAGQIYQNVCWNPATNALTFPNFASSGGTATGLANAGNTVVLNSAGITEQTNPTGNWMAFDGSGAGFETLGNGGSSLIEVDNGSPFDIVLAANFGIDLAPTGVTATSLEVTSTSVTSEGLPFSVNLTGSTPTAPSNTILSAANVSGVATRTASISYGSTAFFSDVAYGGTVFTPVALTGGIQVGGFNGWAYNGTGLNGPIAAFRVFTNQTQTTGAAGSYADIATTPNGTTTEAEVLKFENDAGMDTPTATGGDKGAGTLNAAGLYVNGVAVNTSTAAVASVSNSDGSLTVTPTIGAVVASLNVAHANTWTGAQTIAGAGTLTFDGTTSGSATAGCQPTTTCTFFGGSVPASFSRYLTASNCNTTSTSTSPAACSSAPTGVILTATSATSFTINTTSVSAASRFSFSYDTHTTNCTTAPSNIASLFPPYVSAVVAGTSFTITFPVAPLTTGVCVEFMIWN